MMGDSVLLDLEDGNGTINNDDDDDDGWKWMTIDQRIPTSSGGGVGIVQSPNI